jgi:hypothetical protein
MSKTKKNQESIRFCVRQGNKSSSTWILWSNKNDLYIAPRNIAGLQKASLHESGFLNFSFTKQYFDLHQPLEGHITRHIGSQKLNICKEGFQNVLKIEIPLGESLTVNSEFQDEIENIIVAEELKGTITIFITLIPEFIREKLDYGTVPNFLKSFCNGRYLSRWEHHPEKEIKKYNVPGGFFEKGAPIKYNNLREVSMGFDDEFTMGGFIDKNFSDYDLLP